MTDQVKCRTCDGSGQTSGHAQTNLGCYWGPLPCSTCRGWGTIDADLLVRRRHGQGLIDDRRARGMTLSQEAKRLGIDVVELSRLEHPTSKREWSPEAGRPLREWCEARRAAAALDQPEP